MAIRTSGISRIKNGSLRAWIQHITVNAAQLQLKIAFDVDLEEPRQQPRPDHLLEWLAVAGVWCIRQVDYAPQVQRRLLRPAHSMSDMKQGLEGTRHESI